MEVEVEMNDIVNVVKDRKEMHILFRKGNTSVIHFETDIACNRAFNKIINQYYFSSNLKKLVFNPKQVDFQIKDVFIQNNN
jgi:hypothetical protein